MSSGVRQRQFIAWVGLVLVVSSACGATRELSAEEIFRTWVSRDLRLSPNATSIILDRGEVYEDDGPASGETYQPNVEELSDEVWARKELIVANPRAASATLVSAHRGDPTIRINGKSVPLEPVKVGRFAWKAFRFDPKILRAGVNTFTFSVDGRLPIALDEDYAAGSRTRTHHPNRSARSTDGGKTWDDSHLGPEGKLDGEYEVRLFLDHERGETPRLGAIAIDADHQPASDWAASVVVTAARNDEIVRTAIEFEYEPFDEPRLAQFRREYQLDEVVQGAKTEFDLITRLAFWASVQWKGHHLAKSYPAWNALEILQAHPDGKRVGGFCQQYNVVFLQACESFGLVGRATSLGPGASEHKFPSGHEVVEIWSNEYRKWVYVDGNLARYAMNPDTKVPLSLWEMRERQFMVLAEKTPAPIELVPIAPTTRKWESLLDVPYVELRMIPRSNFLQTIAPLPLSQGMDVWSWTGPCIAGATGWRCIQ